MFELELVATEELVPVAKGPDAVGVFQPGCSAVQ